MKVLRIISRLNIGGPARHVVLLDRGLRTAGHETLLVHGSLADGEGSFEQLAHDAAVPTRVVSELGRRISPLSDVRALLTLVGIVFREKPDVVHTHTAKAGTLGRLAAALFNSTRGRRRRALVVHTFHGHVLDGYFSPLGNQLARAAERSLARFTDRIVVISLAQRTDIVDRFRIGSDARTSVVPLGLDLAPLLDPTGTPDRSLRRRFGIDDDEVVVGFAGRFVPIKDVPTLLRAFRTAVCRHPRMRLMLAGDGPLRPELEALATSLGIADRVHFLVWMSDLTALYDSMDVCALSSRNEGTPVFVIEAMAAGKAIAATAVGGVPDVIADGETGLLVAPGAVEALGAALLQLATCPEERARLGRAARESARRYSAERLVSDIDALYTRELARKRGTY